MAPTFRYCMETEVHVYAFSIAANVLLSFFPFLIVMISFCRYVLNWHAAEEVIYIMLADVFPDQLGEFIRHNLRVTVAQRGPFQVMSVLLLLFTANGIFEPLEVALNRAWGGVRNRSYLKNQLISLGMIFACGGLGLLSTMLTAFNRQLLDGVQSPLPMLTSLISVVFFKMAAIPMSILILFLIYWVLPNRKIRAIHIAPVAIIIGLLLEALKYINLLMWPWLRDKLRLEYGPFHYSATIVLWSFLAAMLILAGAEWSARRALRQEAGAAREAKAPSAEEQAAAGEPAETGRAGDS